MGLECIFPKLNSLLEILNIPPEFCFNADESSFFDFVGIKKQSVIVLIDAPEDMVRGTSRSTKRALLIGTIWMDGSNFKPLIVVVYTW